MKSIKYERIAILFLISAVGLTCRSVHCEVNNSTEDLVQVLTSSGILEGRYRHTTKNVKFASFENIPFAEPPIGELRFKDTKPVKNWEGIRKATSPGHLCPQFNMKFEFYGNEDCLVLDIYTPSLKPEKLLPVMVHYPGGGFVMSTKAMLNSPYNFINEGILFVSVNYRLGVLGFLSLGTEEVPGNAGLKDQVMSLRWIKNNIAAFGGNPELITAFGESAGGTSTSLLQITDMTKGLLHGVISMSSTSLNEWAIERDPKGRVQEFAKNLGLNPDNDNLLELLRAQPAEKLVAVTGGFITETGKLEFPWKVVKEKKFDNVEGFITRWPEEYYELNQFHHVPAIIGYGSHEGAGFLHFIDNEILSQELVPAKKWNLTVGSNLYNEAIERVRKFYLHGKEFNSADRTLLLEGINLLSDVWFSRDINDGARTLARHSSAPVYYYRFAYHSDVFGIPAINMLNFDGASHAEELFYLFDASLLDETSRDNLTRRRLFKLFKNFALTGNPTPDKDDPLIPITWPPMTKDVANYMEIKDNLTTGTDPDGERFAFWRELREYVRQRNTHGKEEL